MRNKATIYILTEPNGGIARYVGKTTRDPGLRYEEHFHASQLRHNNHKNYWLRSHLRRGTTPGMEILAVVDAENADAAEIAYIAAFRMMGFDLVNGTDGGDGGSAFLGRTHSERTKVLISGEKHHNVKLTESSVTDILDLYAMGTWSQKELAGKFDVSCATICLIVNRQRWKCIEGYKLKASKMFDTRNPNAKLTKAKVIELRRLYDSGEFLQRELAEYFGITQSLVSLVALHKIWKSI